MKNKKGFTLIEILTVTALLSVIIILIVPNIFKYSVSFKEKLYEEKIEEILSSAYKYGTDNIDTLTSTCSYIKVEDLIKKEYLKEDKNKSIINPINNESMNDLEICIYYSDGVKTKVK